MHTISDHQLEANEGLYQGLQISLSFTTEGFHYILLLYIETFLHPGDKSYLVMEYDPFTVPLNLFF